MISDERITELLDYTELVLGWDPIGASDLRGDLIKWAHGFDDENQDVEDAVAKFEKDPIYMQYFAKPTQEQIDRRAAELAQPIFTTLSLQDGVRILVSSKKVSIEEAKTIFLIALSNNVLSQNNNWQLTDGTASLDDFLTTELNKLDIQQSIISWEKELSLISNVRKLIRSS
jgi:hypothetical protein